MGDDNSRIDPTPDIKSGHFSFDRDGFKCDGIAASPVEELRLLFRKNPAGWRVRRATQAWTTAQLRFYDVPFEPTDTLDTLRDRLEVAVKLKKCNELPRATQAIASSLRSRYYEMRGGEDEAVSNGANGASPYDRLKTPAQKCSYDLNRFMAEFFLEVTDVVANGDDHQPPPNKPAPRKTPQPLAMHRVDLSQIAPLKAAVRATPGLVMQATRYPNTVLIGWEHSFLPAMRAEFEALSTKPDLHPAAALPTAEANFSLGMFMEKYFVDPITRHPDPSKTPEPLVLDRRFEQYMRLVEKSRETDGLDVDEYDGHSVVGWGTGNVRMTIRKLRERKRLSAEAKEKTTRELAKKEEEKPEAVWEKPHRDFVAKHVPRQGPLTLLDLQGSYLIKMDFFKHGEDPTGKKGEQRLDTDKMLQVIKVEDPDMYGTVARFNNGHNEGVMLLALSEESLWNLKTKMEEDIEEDKEEDGDAANAGFTPANGRKRKPTKQKEPASRIKRQLSEGHPNVPEHPGRVYFFWSGRNLDPKILWECEGSEEDQHGYFDFDLPGKVVARGTWSIPAWWKMPAPFELLKTADVATKGLSETWAEIVREEREFRK